MGSAASCRSSTCRRHPAPKRTGTGASAGRHSRAQSRTAAGRAGAAAESRAAGASAGCTTRGGATKRAASARTTGSSQRGLLLFTRAFRTTPSSTRRAAAKQIFFLFLFLFVALGYDGGIRICLLIVIGVFSAIPEAIAVILVDRPAAILVVIIIVGSLAATEATEIVRLVVVRKTQWLHWFTARH